MATKQYQNKLIEALFKPRATRHDKEVLFENLGEMLAAQIEIAVAIKILRSELKSKGALGLLSQFEQDIDEGYPIWKSIQRAGILGGSFLAILRIGEESGRLSENAAIVISQIKKDRDLRGRVRSASIYPAVVLVLMLVIGIAVVTFVLPRIASTYKSLNVDLPAITNVIIWLGDFFQNYGQIVLPILIVGSIGLIYLIFFAPKTRIIGQRLILITPVVKDIIVQIEMSRLGLLLGTLIESGFPLLASLDLLTQSTIYLDYQKMYRFLKDEIEAGNSFQDAFTHYPNIRRLFPIYARQLIISAQQTGTLSQTLKNIGETYEQRNNESTRNLSVLVEPILLIIIWVGVAVLAFAVILPIYSLIGNITEVSQQRNTNLQDTETVVEP